MQFANQIVQEGDASPADVFLTENSPAMALVDGAGLFAPVATETLEQVPGAVPPGRWPCGPALPPARRCLPMTRPS